jgi:hypothetical protein
MAIKFTRQTDTLAIQLHLVAESCTICSSHSRWPVRKLLDTPSYLMLRGGRCYTVCQKCTEYGGWGGDQSLPFSTNMHRTLKKTTWRKIQRMKRKNKKCNMFTSYTLPRMKESLSENWLTCCIVSLTDKGKVVTVLWVPRHEDVLREWMYSPIHSWPRY